ncbi:hypothetical protein LBMAG56_21510 [Verrucomicrobiota bacterium]|nr:hypothetical protein LBMAG56_21510 [Verrucomicrobiota bacterium]
MPRPSPSPQDLVLLMLLGAGLGLLALRSRTPAPSPSPVLDRPAPPQPRPRGTITFTKDIAPLIHRHCAECHRPDAPGPFSLLTYADVQKRARQIVDVTRRRVMPPWLPEPGLVAYLNQRDLRPDELGLLQQWVDEGAVEGNPANLPAPPTWPGGWQLGAPDLILKMPAPYRLAPDGPDIYRNFVIPTGLTNGQFVRAVAFQPGGRGVHHVRVLLDDSGQCRKLDDDEPGPGFGGWMPPARFPPGHFVTWTPGKAPTIAGDGLAWRLDAGTDVVLQMHLQRSGKEELIQPLIGFYFTNAPPTRAAFALGLAARLIDIPAGTNAYAVRREFQLPVAVEVLRVMPHAHYLAKRMEAFALLPDGTRRELLRINDWDFNWQDEYRLAVPLTLPAGTFVRMEYTFDNSVANPRNPNHPPQPVRYGPQSTDEMAEFWLQVVPADSTALNRLAAAQRTQDTRETVAYFEQKLTTQPRDVNARVELGKALGALGRTADAKQQFTLALQTQPDSPEALYFLGLALLNERDFAAAKTHFTAALQARPTYARAEHGLALIALEHGQLDEAEQHLRNAERLNPHDPLPQRTRERLARERAKRANPDVK